MDPKITYVFGSGRTIKLESNNQSAKDFFYGYLDFKDEFIERAYKCYKDKFTIDLTPIEITICDGVKIKNLQTD